MFDRFYVVRLFEIRIREERGRGRVEGADLNVELETLIRLESDRVLLRRTTKYGTNLTAEDFRYW